MKANSTRLRYVCNGFVFDDIQAARAYANYYFDCTGIVCGIEKMEG